MRTKTGRSSRTKGAVGANAKIPRVLRKFARELGFTKEARVLDFGAGAHAAHARAFQAEGYNVTAYEEENFNRVYHDANALDHSYDIVYASNVLNTQKSLQELRRTIGQLRRAVKRGGLLVANYPSNPRYIEILGRELYPGEVMIELREHFGTVDLYSYKDKLLREPGSNRASYYFVCQ